jgi:hypothetical protein
MKKMMIATFIVVILISSSVPALAEDGADAPVMIVDVFIARPVGLATTDIGTAAFIVALPFAIPSGSVKPVGRELVAAPFKFTFRRPVGDFSFISSRMEKP